LFASAEPKRETEKAALYDIMFTPDFEGSISVGYDIWVPKSQIEVKGNNLCLSKWAVINCLLPVYNRHN
jgi:hypothetical protein